MENKYNPKEFINKKEKDFTKEMVNDTLRYQKLYGFDIGKDDIAVDNEADAFRHTYMQAYLSLFYGGNLIAKRLGDYHENQGKKRGNDPRSMNMDLWNNRQGREIANEIRREYPNFNKLSESQQKDIIAYKVMQKMREGKLITNLADIRKFEEPKPNFIPMRNIGGVRNNGIPLGFATPVNEQNLFGYTNPLSGNNRIFTREEVGAMTPEEFKKHVYSNLQFDYL